MSFLSVSAIRDNCEAFQRPIELFAGAEKSCAFSAMLEMIPSIETPAQLRRRVPQQEPRRFLI